jgi:hypothetical protein
MYESSSIPHPLHHLVFLVLLWLTILVGMHVYLKGTLLQDFSCFINVFVTQQSKNNFSALYVGIQLQTVPYIRKKKSF